MHPDELDDELLELDEEDELLEELDDDELLLELPLEEELDEEDELLLELDEGVQALFRQACPLVHCALVQQFPVTHIPLHAICPLGQDAVFSVLS